MQGLTLAPHGESNMSKQSVFNESTKSKFVRSIKVWMSVLALFSALGGFMSNRTELAEAYERVTCGKACPSLAAEELRLNVIKAYLHHRLSTTKTASDGGGQKLFLLPVQLDAQSLAQGVRDETLVETLTTNTLLLSTHQEIDALDTNVFKTHPSIAWYSLQHREATVIPIQSIQPIRLQDVDPSLEPHVAAARRIGRWERLRGYGEHFFQVTEYWGLNLSCCDGQGDRRGLSPAWFKKNSLQNIQSTRPWIFAVSDRGAILLWEGMGESPGLTYILLAAQPYRLLPHQQLPLKERREQGARGQVLQ